MWTLVIVILDPVDDSFLGALNGSKFRPNQKFFVDRLPETLDLAKRLGMMWSAAEMMNPVAAQLFFKGCFSPPACVLPPIIGQQFLRFPIFPNRTPIYFQNVFRRLAQIYTQSGNIAGVIVDESDQPTVDPGLDPEAHNIALPHLVRSIALKKTRLLWVPFDFPFF